MILYNKGFILNWILLKEVDQLVDLLAYITKLIT